MLEKTKLEMAKKKAKRSTAKVSEPVPHDHTPQLKRLRRIKGQIEGIEKMILDRRYCPEIVMQIKAVRSALLGLETAVIEGHMRHCVQDAIASGDPAITQKKIDEVVALIRGQSS